MPQSKLVCDYRIVNLYRIVKRFIVIAPAAYLPNLSTSQL